MMSGPRHDTESTHRARVVMLLTQTLGSGTAVGLVDNAISEAGFDPRRGRTTAILCRRLCLPGRGGHRDGESRRRPPVPPGIRRCAYASWSRRDPDREAALGIRARPVRGHLHGVL